MSAPASLLAWVALGAACVGCVEASTASTRPAPDAAGSTHDAVLAALGALESSSDSAETAQLRREIEALALGPSARSAAARGLLALIDQRASLQATIAWLAVDVNELRAKLEAAELELEAGREQSATDSKQLERLRDERQRLTRSLEEVESKLAERAKQVEKLQRELEALKNIDMERAP